MLEKLKKLTNLSNKTTKEIMIPVIAVGLIILGFAGFGAYQKWRDNTEKKAYEAVISEVNSAYSQSNFKAAEDALTKYLSKDRPTEYAYLATMQLGSTYINLSDHKKALDTFKRAEQLNPYDKVETRVYYQIALQSSVLGDKQQAIDYFEKTIQAARTDEDPFNDAFISSYEQQISELKQ